MLLSPSTCVLFYLAASSHRSATTEPVPAAPESQAKCAALVEPASHAAPAFGFETLDGSMLTDELLRGKVVVLNFGTPDCNFCRKQIPQVEQARRAVEGDDVVFVNIALPLSEEMDEVAVRQGYLAAGVPESSLVAFDVTANLKGLFKITAFPTLIVLDRDMRISVTNRGVSEHYADLVTRQVRAVQAGENPPPMPTERKAKKSDKSKLRSKPERP